MGFSLKGLFDALDEILPPAPEEDKERAEEARKNKEKTAKQLGEQMKREAEDYANRFIGKYADQLDTTKLESMRLMLMEHYEHFYQQGADLTVKLLGEASE